MIAFNEIDPVACAVLRANYAGDVLERSIKDVRLEDVAGYERMHFFAGAGLWEVAAQLAGWVGPLWSASCPCQPFSVAGKGAGRDDPRHLWPDFFRLARAVRPAVIVGEQVAGAAGFDWFDGVAADLEGEGYACRAVDIPACAVDAPHRRQRLYWVALANANESFAPGQIAQCAGQLSGHEQDARHDQRDVALADADCRGRGGRPQDPVGVEIGRDAAERADDILGDTRGARLALRSIETVERGTVRHERTPVGATDHGSFWMDAEWLQCADGKARRSKPGIRLLVDGLEGRADLWRLAGNSIVPQIAAQVLLALKEALEDRRSVRLSDLFG